MQVFVTGATGVLGKAIIPKLIAGGSCRPCAEVSGWQSLVPNARVGWARIAEATRESAVVR